MPPDTAPPTNLAFATEHARWQALIESLLAEEQALIDGAADTLQALANSKQQRLEALAETVRARVAGLATCGYPNDADGVSRWLALYGDSTQRTHWQAIVQLEATARTINQRNGGLIDQRLAVTRQALNVLHGAATHNGALYDARGQNQPPRGGRPLNAA